MNLISKLRAYKFALNEQTSENGLINKLEECDGPSLITVDPNRGVMATTHVLFSTGSIKRYNRQKIVHWG